MNINTRFNVLPFPLQCDCQYNIQIFVIIYHDVNLVCNLTRLLLQQNQYVAVAESRGITKNTYRDLMVMISLMLSLDFFPQLNTKYLTGQLAFKAKKSLEEIKQQGN